MARPVSRIYWPSHLNAFNRSIISNITAADASDTIPETGYIIGWNIRSLVCCVATVVFVPVQWTLARVEGVLAEAERDPAFHALWQYCGGAPVVLGQWFTQPPSAMQHYEATPEEVERRKRNVWMTLQARNFPAEPKGSMFAAAASAVGDVKGASIRSQPPAKHPAVSSPESASLPPSARFPASGRPELSHMYVCGYRYATTNQMVLYDRPNTQNHHYFSTKAFTFETTPHASSNGSNTDLECTLRQINSAFRVEHCVVRRLWRSAVEFTTALPPPLPFTIRPHSSVAAAAADGSIRLRNTPNSGASLSGSENELSPPSSPAVTLRSTSASASSAAGATSAGAEWKRTLIGVLGTSSGPALRAPSLIDGARIRFRRKRSFSSAQLTPPRPPASTNSMQSLALLFAAAACAAILAVAVGCVIALDSAVLVWWLDPLLLQCAIVAVAFYVNAYYFADVWVTVWLVIWSFVSPFAQPLVLLPLRVVAWLTLVVLNRRLPSPIARWSNTPNARVKHISTLGLQLERRIRAVCNWPYMWLRTRGRHYNNASLNSCSVAFYSSVWRLVLDLAAGVLLGLVLRRNSDLVLWLLHQMGQILHLDVLRNQMVWLMGLPAGMKLNAQLNRCLGSLVLSGIELWDSLTTVLTPLEPLILHFVSLVGLGGASFLIALASDILSLMTLHIDFAHTGFSRLYAFMLSVLGSLWKLFRGKKLNVLRHRVDSCEYDMDQLVLGTLLFTIVFFLFPTIAIYYVFFSFVRLMVTLAQAALWWTLAFFHYFPFFAVIRIYIFDRKRLPGGVAFERLSAPNAPNSTNAPLPAAGAAGAASPAGGIRFVDSPDGTISPLAAGPSDAGFDSGTSAGASAGNGTSRGSTSAAAASASTYLLLRTSPVPLSALFYQYKLVLGEIFKFYTPSRIISTLLSGAHYPTSGSTSNLTAKVNAEHDTNSALQIDQFVAVVHFWWFMRMYL